MYFCPSSTGGAFFSVPFSSWQWIFTIAQKTIGFIVLLLELGGYHSVGEVKRTPAVPPALTTAALAFLADAFSGLSPCPLSFLCALSEVLREILQVDAKFPLSLVVPYWG